MRTIALIIGMTLLVSIVYVCLMTCKQMTNEVRLVRMQVEGRELALLIWGSDENSDVSYLSTCSNSTEALEYLSQKHNFGISNRVKDGPFESVEEIKEFIPENNVWLIAKNLPRNAPRQTVVLATHNVNPEFLKTNYETNDLSVTPFHPSVNGVGALKRYALLIRKNGAMIKIRKKPPLHDINSNRAAESRRQYELLYDEPFDIWDEGSNKLSLIYLTPTGEINVTEAHMGALRSPEDAIELAPW